MTEIILLSVLIILVSAAIVLLVALLLKKNKSCFGDADGALRRIEEKTDAIGNLTDYNLRAVEKSERATEARLQNIQSRLTDDIKYIVESNAQNLEKIRRTVDEKLASSIDGKLSESYARICERLEKMYESVGEMKSLSTNVADIKRVFSNVKLRGTWGEEQLASLLEQMLSAEQFERSVKLNPLQDSLVDFAVLLPSKEGEKVYLPIDSKFPLEEFDRLCTASERGDREGTAEARKNLERAVKLQADSIAKKYILPPMTTDFAIMYLPSESLYAEVLKIDGLGDFLRKRRILVCGPTNAAALLSTLQTAFRTSAIERRSGELREMLEGFRADFFRFSELLEKTRKKLQEAQDAVESAEKRTGAIGRKLDTFRRLDGE